VLQAYICALLRHAVAKIMEMAIDDTTFLASLKYLDSDLLWDEENAIEKGFIEMKEPRYDLTQVRLTWSKTKLKEKEAERLSGTKEQKNKKSITSQRQEQMDAAASAGIPIKIENPLLLKLKDQIKTAGQLRGITAALVFSQMGSCVYAAHVLVGQEMSPSPLPPLHLCFSFQSCRRCFCLLLLLLMLFVGQEMSPSPLPPLHLCLSFLSFLFSM
jgi:hypothetical protein